MNGHVSISTSAYSIYNAANRNDADNSSWFRVIRRCIYRSSITGRIFALRINSDSITFHMLEIVSSWRYPCVLSRSKAFYRFSLFENWAAVENFKNRSLYHGTRSTERLTRELKRRYTWRGRKGGPWRAAINTAINRRYKSLALLPSVSISLSVPLSYPGWILADDEDDNEKKAGTRRKKSRRSEHPRVGRGTNARTRFHKRTRRRGCSR